MVTSAKIMSTTPSHSSVAVAMPKSGVAPHSIGLTTSGQIRTGAALSSIKKVAEQLEVLPQSSVAIHVLIKLYSCGQRPAMLTSEKVISGNASQASIAVALSIEKVVPHSTEPAMIGQVITGAVLSCTLM